MPLYRLGFGALVLVAIIVQMVSLGQSGVLDPLHYLTFFTNLSNEIAAIVFLVGAARWRSDRSHAFDLVRGGAVVYMTITGVVFAVLLVESMSTLKSPGSTTWSTSSSPSS